MTRPLDIDRLVLRAPGLTEIEGRQLVALIAERLASLRVPEVPGRERVRVFVGRHGFDLESVADHIVSQLAANLEGSPW